MILGVLVVMIVITTLVVAYRASGPAATHLKASVQLGVVSVEVRNEDAQVWRNVRVRLSDKYFCPPTEMLEPSKSTVVLLATCTSSNGERFIPATLAPTNVVVSATLGEGMGEAIAGFAPRRP